MNRTVEEILKQYPYIGEDIQKAQKEINRYIELQQEARNPLKGQALTGMLHTSGVSDQTYNAVAKIIDLYQEEIDIYLTEINELLNRKKWLDKAFSELTEDERRILFMKYDKGMSMRKIPYAMKCGKDKAYSLLEGAVDKVRRIAC